MTAIIMVCNGIADIASAVIGSGSDVGSLVKVKGLPAAVSGNKTIDADTLQYIATAIPEVTDDGISTVSRLTTGQVYLELVKVTGIGDLETLSLADINITGTCTKPGFGRSFGLRYD